MKCFQISGKMPSLIPENPNHGVSRADIEICDRNTRRRNQPFTDRLIGNLLKSKKKFGLYALEYFFTLIVNQKIYFNQFLKLKKHKLKWTLTDQVPM